MRLCNALCGLSAVVALFHAGDAASQFDTCVMVNAPLGAGTDPINHVRLAVRGDGRPILVYTTDVHNDSSLYAYDCGDPACRSGHVVYLDTSSNYFGAPGIVIRGNGNPLISAQYFGGVNLYDCGDPECAAHSVTPIRATASAIFSDLPIVLQANGNPLLLYVDAVSLGMGMPGSRPGQLIAHFCDDATCSDAGTEQVLAIPPGTSYGISELSLALDTDYVPAATYLTSEGASNLYTYSIARCYDAGCASVTNTQISAPVSNSTPTLTALSMRSDLRPLALDNQGNNRALLDCAAAACTSFDNRALPAAAAGQPLGLGILPGDRPAFALFGAQNVAAFACSDTTCASGGTLMQAASAQNDVLDGAFTLDANLRAAIAYIDFDTRALAAARCMPDPIFADGFE